MKSFFSLILCTWFAACGAESPVIPEKPFPPAEIATSKPPSDTIMSADTSTEGYLLPEKFNDKEIHLKKIFDRLWAVYSDQVNFEKPGFEVEDKDNLVAEYHPTAEKPTILFGIKAYDILKKHLPKEQFEAALALIIGHELQHYIYYGLHPDNRNGREIHNFMEHLAPPFYGQKEGPEEEAIADYGGAFNAWLARFDISPGLYRNMIDILYGEFKIEENNKKYPPRSERQKTAENTEKMLEELRELYRHAPNASAAGAYSIAAAMYDTLLKYYPAKEIYNNAGLNYLLKKVADTHNYALLLPVEADPESRLLHYDKSTSMGSAGDEALNKLNKALELAPNYLPARLNLLCYYAFTGNEKEAGIQYEAIAKRTQNTLSNLVFAAAASAWATVKKDTVHLRKLSENTECLPCVRHLAGHNLAVLQRRWSKPPEKTPSPACVIRNLKKLPFTSGPDWVFSMSSTAFQAISPKTNQSLILESVAIPAGLNTFSKAIQKPGAKPIRLSDDSQMIALPSEKLILTSDKKGNIRKAVKYCIRSFP